jgi:hypothetical protein
VNERERERGFANMMRVCLDNTTANKDFTTRREPRKSKAMKNVTCLEIIMILKACFRERTKTQASTMR